MAKALQRFLFNQHGQKLEEAETVREHSLDILVRAVQELHRRRRCDPIERINLDLFHQHDRLIGSAFRLEAAQSQRDRKGRRLGHEIALWNSPREARRQDQELAPITLVCAQRTDVGEVALQTILKEAQHVWRRFNNGRAICLQIEVGERINRLGVGREQHRPRVHQLFPDDNLLRRSGAERAQAFTQPDLAHRHQLRCVDFNRTIELLKFEQPLSRVANRIAILELEVAEARLQRLGAEPSLRIGLLRGFHSVAPIFDRRVLAGITDAQHERDHVSTVQARQIEIWIDEVSFPKWKARPLSATAG